MPAELEIKLQDLVKIALGTPQFSKVNIAILHSLIEILLKKLNCQQETVSVNAHECKLLENILKTAQMSPIVFNDERIEKVSEKLARLDQLQECVRNMEEKLEKHLQEAQRTSNFNETAVDWENWSSYGCDHLCTTCDTENEMACTLLKNTDFIKKLLRRLSAPIVERMFSFEDKLEQLNEEFTAFAKQAEQEYSKIQLLEKCMKEIDELRQVMQEQQKRFLAAMEEIQDLLDSKLDKIYIPALKQYIRDNFQRIDRTINALQDKQQCPRAAGIILQGVRCVSCGNSKVCSDVGVQPAAMLPDVSVKSKALQKHWAGKSDGKTSKEIAALAWHVGDFATFRQAKATGEQQNSPTCGKAGDDFQLLEGFDGQLYRKG